MSRTYEPIAQTILQSNLPSVSFGSLSGYTDLHVVIVSKSANTSGNAAIGLRLNGDSSTGYSNHWFSWYNNTIYSEGNSNVTSIGSFMRLNVTAGGDARWGVAELDIFSYSNTATHKTITGTSFTDQEILKVTKGVGVWRSTAAITSLTFFASTGNFVAGSTFSIYGIQA